MASFHHDKSKRHLPKLLRTLSASSLRTITALFLTTALLNALHTLLLHPASIPISPADIPIAPLPLHLVRTQDPDNSIFLFKPHDYNCPPEPNPPSPSLYATASERCFALGVPDTITEHVSPGRPASFWQINSRALCYFHTPVCLYGRKLNRALSFQKRGSGACRVVRVANGHQRDMRSFGANESCDAFRFRNVFSMYAESQRFENYDAWLQYAHTRNYSNSRRHPIQWESTFAIVVPPYKWSANICHYNRIWNFIIYIIRNLHLFVPNSHLITHIDVKFRSGFKYATAWHVGLRNATLPVLQSQTGKTIQISKLRKDVLRDFQCIRQGILLGREGRVDSFPFLNDTPVYNLRHAKSDDHWPTIPHASLWFREAIYKSFHLPSVGTYTGLHFTHFHSIPVPPRRVGILRRSPNSKRRLTKDAQLWFDAAVTQLAHRYHFDLVDVRFSANMTLRQQVEKVRHLGLATGVHGANLVNTVFMPPAGALFEIFPYRYVRFYYAAGSNSGLRYSFHEPLQGEAHVCKSELQCVFRYREAKIYFSAEDRSIVYAKLEKAFLHVVHLHERFPGGRIALKEVGNYYEI